LARATVHDSAATTVHDCEPASAQDDSKALCDTCPEEIRITVRRRPKWARLLADSEDAGWSSRRAAGPSGSPLTSLAFGLALVATLAQAAWVNLPDNTVKIWPVPVFGCCLLALPLVLGYTFSYFNSVAALALCGKVKQSPFADPRPSRALLYCAQWLGCFLCGPAVLLICAAGYWINCGEVTPLDWLVLAELCLAAVGWWLISLVLSNAGDRVRVPSPRSVFRTACSLGPAAVRQVVIVSSIYVGHAIVALLAAARLHDEPLLGFVLLCLACGSGLYYGIFAFRRVGAALIAREPSPYRRVS
jgi:hypothetical protein